MRVEVIGPYYIKGNSTEKVREIRAGRKKLTLAVLPWRYTTCRIDNTRTWFRRKGETTAKFQRAREILQREARESGEITFEVETSNDRIKYWLEHQGKSLFEFNITPTIDDPMRVQAEAVIRGK